MFSGTSNSDIARCIPRRNDVERDAIRPRSGRAVLWLLRPSVRRKTCFPRRLGRKAPQQDQQRLGGLTGVTPLTLYREWILRITRAWGAEI
jgi:hypothetical protein